MDIKKPKNNFPCTACGACCKRIDKAIKNASFFGAFFGLLPEDYAFPYTYDETGKCENLQSDNTCGIYETRPLICNVDKLMLKLKVSKAAFYKMNANACNKIQKEQGISEKFRVLIDE